jgi:hypothetical protein
MPNAKKMNVVDISNKKEILGIFNETLKDFEVVSLPSNEELRNSLKNILETKTLSVLNISSIYPYLNDYIVGTSSYEKMLIETVSIFGEDRGETIVSQLKAEHLALHTLINQHFDITVMPRNIPYIISIKEEGILSTEAEEKSSISSIGDTLNEEQNTSPSP